MADEPIETPDKPPDQMRTACTFAMGEDLGATYHALYNEVLWLHWKWAEYHKLFSRSSARIGLLNASAPFFFYTVQTVMHEDIVLHIARLTDPAEQRGRKNLTLRRLGALVTDGPLQREMRSLIRTAHSSAKFTEIWRNKHLAHRDLPTVLGAQALPPIERQDIEEALQAFGDCLNCLHSHYFGSPVVFQDVGGSGSADCLVAKLALASQVESARSARFERDEYLEGDLEPLYVPD